MILRFGNLWFTRDSAMFATARVDSKENSRTATFRFVPLPPALKPGGAIG